MFTKTVVPDSASITIDLPANYVGEHVRVIAIIEKDENAFSEERRKNVSQVYSNYPKVDLTKFKFDREEANDFE
jgi:hypothetical protein